MVETVCFSKILILKLCSDRALMLFKLDRGVPPLKSSNGGVLKSQKKMKLLYTVF
jgi:hypothetical protein